MIDILCVPGTGEHAAAGSDRPVGMLAEVTKHLDDDRFAPWNVAYPASYGPFGGDGVLGLDYVRSVDQGVEALLAEVRSTTNSVGLLGYSQGATVVSRFLEGMTRGDYPDVEVAFVGLIANPMRGQGWVSVDGSNVGYGIAGEHGPWPDDFPVWEIANPRDPICSLPGSSPLRGFADLTAAFSIADPAWWGQQLVDMTNAATMQRWLRVGATDFVAGLDEALDYAVRGEHTCYGSRQIWPSGRTYTEELARLIDKQFPE
ncbi:PE-PPE domain-containing protein [Nocardia sp. NPDC051570]|uniref:PE-PPE domain-containing protein n=1 Tax=Nocardia sp. NPDC051570 TaxID=3364324 RepID=UPI0037A339C9